MVTEESGKKKALEVSGPSGDFVQGAPRPQNRGRDGMGGFDDGYGMGGYGGMGGGGYGGGELGTRRAPFQPESVRPPPHARPRPALTPPRSRPRSQATAAPTAAAAAATAAAATAMAAATAAATWAAAT